MTGATIIKNHQALRKQKQILKQGYWKPCFSKINNLCYKQVVPITTFESNETLKIYHTFHLLNCKSSPVIHLLECLKCKIQYVGKSENQFKIRCNHHKKDVTRNNSTPASNLCNIEGHHFKHQAKMCYNRTTQSETSSQINALKVTEIFSGSYHYKCYHQKV